MATSVYSGDHFKDDGFEDISRRLMDLARDVETELNDPFGAEQLMDLWQEIADRRSWQREKVKRKERRRKLIERVFGQQPG